MFPLRENTTSEVFRVLAIWGKGGRPGRLGGVMPKPTSRAHAPERGPTYAQADGHHHHDHHDSRHMPCGMPAAAAVWRPTVTAW
jgi:hypothetical protein